MASTFDVTTTPRPRRGTRALGQSIESLLSLESPTKKRRKQSSTLPTSPQKRKVSAAAASPTAAPEASAASASPTAAPEAEAPSEETILLKLFDGMEALLRYSASRRRHTPLEALREDLEAHTGRILTTERLEKVLALAGGMFEIAWIGTGKAAFLAVEQRNEDGKPQAPTAGELGPRKLQFEAALAAAVQSKTLPCRSLPLHPDSKKAAADVSENASTTSQADAERAAAASAALTAVAALPQLARAGSSEKRMEALRARVRAKKEFLDREAAHEAELGKLDAALGACEDALTAHKVLTSLFARGEGRASSATENELLAAVCSLSFAVQCKRQLSLEAGRAAIARLKEHGVGTWFYIEEAVLSTTAGCYLRRLPGGSMCAARESLVQELQKLREEKRKIAAKGAHFMVEPTAVKPDAGAHLTVEPTALKPDAGSEGEAGHAEAIQGAQSKAKSTTSQTAGAASKTQTKAKAKAKAEPKAKATAKAKAKAEPKAKAAVKAKSKAEPKAASGPKSRRK